MFWLQEKDMEGKKKRRVKFKSYALYKKNVWLILK